MTNNKCFFQQLKGCVLVTVMHDDRINNVFSFYDVDHFQAWSSAMQDAGYVFIEEKVTL